MAIVMAMAMAMAMAYLCVFLRLQPSESQPHRLDQSANFRAGVTFMQISRSALSRVGMGFF